jgi:hypothetical protein
MERACASFAPGDAVLIVDDRGHNEWTQVLRGACGVPTAVLVQRDRATVGRLAERTARAGNRLVLAGGEERPELLAALGGQPRKVVHLVTRTDQQLLTRRPWRTEELVISLWTAPAPRPG